MQFRKNRVYDLGKLISLLGIVAFSITMWTGICLAQGNQTNPN